MNSFSHIFFLFFLTHFAVGQGVITCHYRVMHPFWGSVSASLVASERGSIYVDSTRVGSSAESAKVTTISNNTPTQRKGVTITRTAEGLWLKSDFATNVVQAHEDVGDDIYFVTDSLMPQWKFLDDTLTLYNLKCRKAQCHLRGRTWYVYYAPDIPVPAGPWKLRGLPGLIVQARDSMGNHSYELTGLTTSESNAFSPDSKKIYGEMIGFHAYWDKRARYLTAEKTSRELRMQEFMRNRPGVTVTMTVGPDMSIELSEF